MKYIIAFLLHHANRAIQEVVWGKDEFYIIKSNLLKKYGKHINYDIQKIPGKKCWTCDGTGVYTGYYMMSGEKWQDTCNRCFGGWYTLPKWICLSRQKLGRYYFHTPLKREECVKNPFTKEELGWEVSERPLVIGYIDHTDTWIGRPSLLILFFCYDRVAFAYVKNEIIQQIKSDYYWKWVKIKRKFKFPIVQPQIIMHDLDEENNTTELPF